MFVNVHRSIISLTCNSQSSHSLFHTSPVQCRKGNSKLKNDPVAEFFARFPDFKYNPDCTWPEEWRKLRQHLENQLQQAAIKRFESTISFDPSDLAACHKMCRVLGIIPLPLHIRSVKGFVDRVLSVNELDSPCAGNKTHLRQFGEPRTRRPQGKCRGYAPIPNRGRIKRVHQGERKDLLERFGTPW